MFSTQPFLRYVILLIAGILAVEIGSDSLGQNVQSLSLFIFWIGLVPALIGLALLKRSPKAQSILWASIIFFLGAFVTEREREAFQGEVDSLDSLQFNSYLLEIKSLGQKRKASIRYEAELLAVQSGNTWQRKEVQLLVSFPDSSEILPKAGDAVLVKSRPPNRPPVPLNPDEFDYRKYLEQQGIAWTVFLPKESYKIIFSDRAATTPSSWALAVSQKVDSVFKTQLKTSSSYGLLEAMVLGRRDELGADLLNSYISAGAVHVLAVSGLHVGVFFSLVSWCLSGLRRNKRGKWIYLAIIIFLLCAYAIITGLSPSVVRASLMCVTFALSQAFARQHHGINTLALSAFLILLLDPLSLFSVGFQLSYAAVLGIILFYPLFKNSVETDIFPLRWLWQITLVSLSAQVFTFPLSIYYFHQFPTYFLLVNPFVIGLTTILIYSAVALLLGSIFHFQPLTDFLAYWTEGIAQIMNAFVQIPRRLPKYLLENLSLDAVEVFLLTVLMLFFYKLLKVKEFYWLKRVAICGLVYFSYASARIFDNSTTSKKVIHSVPRHTVLSIKKGQMTYIVADPEFKFDTTNFNFHLKNYLNYQGVTKLAYLDLPDKSLNYPAVIKWKDQILGVDSKVFSQRKSYSLVRAKLYPKFEKIPTAPNTTFILSKELGFKTKNQWKKLLDEARNSTLDLAESGAIELK